MVLRAYELPRDEIDDRDDGFEWSAAVELESGDRICAPLEEPRGSTFWPAALVIAVALTAGWVIAQFPAATQAVHATASALVMGNAPPTAIAEQAATEVAAPTPPPLDVATTDVATTDVAAAPGATAGEAVASVEHDVTADAVASPEPSTEAANATAPNDANAPVEPLPKPVADPKDPNQKRALAAGLHPDVSKALLARMTATDYSNARNAVQKALLQTADGSVLSWPRADVKSGAAFFEVKFVAGAAPGCRRYVVIITKDRWSTTAPPMEKCGDELPKRQDARNRA